MDKARILIVEDSFIVAYHLQTTLESEGYTVLNRCDSAEEALQFVQNNRPDLVLMDIMLSGQVDGIEAASVLKSRYNIPVVYITALSDKNTISRAKVTEPYGFLTKPFEDREIFTVIEMALYKHDIESRLKQSEERYFSTVNSIGDSVITVDRNYRISYMNPSAEAVTQWTASNAHGKMIMDVLRLKNESSNEMINPIQCALGVGNFNRMPDDLVAVGREGVEIPIGESSLSPLLDNKGNFVGLIIIFKNLTEKRAHDRLVKEMERHQMAALIEGQEKERARIAKDLHDGLGQMLNAIKINTSMLNSDSYDISHLSKLLDEAIQESVRISENLLPAKLRDFDLATSLRSFCADIRKATRSQISFEGHCTGLKMNQSQKVNFYRIAQEAVNNAIKHSDAKSICVQLNEENDLVRLSVEDDGSGIRSIPASSSKARNGLVNMRDRAKIMGGKLTIESDPQRGTMVIVEVPTHKLMKNAQS